MGKVRDAVDRIFDGKSHPLYFKIQEDHRLVEKLMDEIEDGDTKKFTELSQALTEHMKLEEQLLYPVLEDEEETHTLSLEAQEEHAAAKKILRELQRGNRSSEQWMAKFKVLKENILHHVREEEGQLLPKAHAILEAEQEDQLVDAWEQKKGVA